MRQQVAAVKGTAELPPISYWLLNPFLRYVRYYVRRHFQGLHLLNAAKAEGLEGWPILICMNHPSWWDPLLALYLSRRFFPQREHYGPIASEGLNKYQFFEKLGFFGIDPKTRAGAAHFLQIGRGVLGRADAALWVTAQGQFTDVRVRPLQLQAGVAHLAHKTPRFVMLPIALEYSFWVDRKPEAFACIGDPVMVEDGSARTTDEWLRAFTTALAETQRVLSETVQSRRREAFECVFHSKAGVGGMYDLWQALKSAARGKSLRSEPRTRLP